MNKTELLLLSMSVSGALLALFLFAARKFLREKLNATFCYYIWLIVLLRCITPFSFENALISQLFRNCFAPGEFSSDGRKIIIGSNVIAPGLLSTNSISIILSIWLVMAVSLLIRKITSYRAFYKYVQSGWQSVDHPEVLDVLGELCEELKITHPVELYTNSLISSPLLLGIFRPVIVLPKIPEDTEILSLTLRHELVHHKRKDALYIWLTQFVLCLHWFNPVLYLVHKQIVIDRELSCDRSVLSGLSQKHRRKYGDTLLASFLSTTTYQERNITTALLEDKQALKKRLTCIASFTPTSKKDKHRALLLLLITLLFFTCLGCYQTHNPKRTTVTQLFGVRLSFLLILL